MDVKTARVDFLLIVSISYSCYNLGNGGVDHMNRVLIVEDNINQCIFLQETLHTAYPLWEVCTATTCEEGLQLLDASIENKQLFTLFLFDVQLTSAAGDRGGFLLAEHLRKQPDYYRTPILFLTAILDDGVFALSNYHCYNYITKPYSAQDIMNQLEQMLFSGYLDKTITIVDTRRIQHMILIDNIEFIQCNKHNVYIYDDHSEYVTRQYTLTQLEEILPCYFVRCHRKYIFNKRYLKNIDFTAKYIHTKDFHFAFSKNYTDRIYRLLNEI